MADLGTMPGDERAAQGAAAEAEPSEREQAALKEVEAFYQAGLSDRRPFEAQWFVNTAYYRGLLDPKWHAGDQRLFSPPSPTYREKVAINLLFKKVRARMAKFLRNRPRPEVRPPTADIKRKQDARMTTQALRFLEDKLRMQRLYEKALMWSVMTNHGYWWFYWDENKLGKVKQQQVDPVTNVVIEETIENGVVGEICIEAGGPFEVLIADPAVVDLADQPKIMRIRMRPVEEMRKRYPDHAERIKPETQDRGFSYDRQLSVLNPATQSGVLGGLDSKKKDEGVGGNEVLVKELFCRPSGDYPEGRYIVAAGGVLLKDEAALPYKFADMGNPFPVVEFTDVENVGQYWGTCVTEQLVPVQRAYNITRSKVYEHIKISTHGKLMAARQHKIPTGAWTNGVGEIVEYTALPGIKEPWVWVPPPIAADVWRTIELLKGELDEISHIFPEAEGQLAGAESGFQTNLLQEAADALHQPDLLRHTDARRDAWFKLRRMMREYYDVPRLISVAGSDRQVEAIEFSRDDIDEHAEIVVEATSALPDMKGARIQSVMEMWSAGIWGAADDPEARRKVQKVLELGVVDEMLEDARQDEEVARMENKFVEEGTQPVPTPEPWENHQVHWNVHTAALKSLSSRGWPNRMELVAHLIGHARFINPTGAIELAMQFGMEELVQDLIQAQQQQMLQQQQQAAAAAPPDPNAPAATPPPSQGGQPPPQMM